MNNLFEYIYENIDNPDILHEGANWDTMKIKFSKESKEAKKIYKNAKELYKDKRYKEASTTFKSAKDKFTKLLNDVKNTKDTFFSDAHGSGLYGAMFGIYGGNGLRVNENDLKRRYGVRTNNDLKLSVCLGYACMIDDCDKYISKCTGVKESLSIDLLFESILEQL